MHKYRFLTLLLCLTLLAGILEPLKTSAAGKRVMISGDIVNIRAGPGESYEVIDKAKKGEAFTILKEEEDWYLVSLEGDRHGWIAGWLGVATEERHSTLGDEDGSDSSPLKEEESKSFLEEKDSSSILEETAEPPAEESNATSDSHEENSEESELQQVGIVITDRLKVRSGPSREHSVIGSLKNGSAVTVLTIQDGWAKITFQNKIAWVSSEYISLNGSPPEINKQLPEEKEANTEKEERLLERETEKSNGDKHIGIITADALKVRDTGSLDGKVIGTVKKGDSFAILEKKNGWVQIEFKPGHYGWVAGWFVDKPQKNIKQKKDNNQKAEKKTSKDRTATILYNGTNIRQEPDAASTVIKRAHAGDAFPILEMKGDWYGILLENGDKAYVAGWLVTVSGRTPRIKKQGNDGSLRNKLIIIDPGHGGKDDGATGIGGTKEKELTLDTARILNDKLRAAGAKVILTRNSDDFVSLNSRVRLSHILEADAYISIHFDSTTEQQVRGITSYYYHPYQKSLASHVHVALSGNTKMKDRGVRFGDYHVIRENNQNAILLELGYLSNPTEETLISSRKYHEQVSDAIVQGLTNFFDR